MSPATGSLSVPLVWLSWIRPPSTTICWSSTMTDDSSARFDSTMPVVVVTDSTRDTSW